MYVYPISATSFTMGLDVPTNESGKKNFRKVAPFFFLFFLLFICFCGLIDKINAMRYDEK